MWGILLLLYCYSYFSKLFEYFYINVPFLSRSGKIIINVILLLVKLLFFIYLFIYFVPKKTFPTITLQEVTLSHRCCFDTFIIAKAAHFGLNTNYIIWIYPLLSPRLLERRACCGPCRRWDQYQTGRVTTISRTVTVRLKWLRRPVRGRRREGKEENKRRRRESSRRMVT